MLMLLSGLIGLVCFGFVTLITLNYSVYLWENQRIEDLASQIKKEKADGALNGRRKSSFTSYSNAGTSSKAIELFNKNEKQLATIDEENQINFNWNGVIDFFKQVWKFLLQLASPPKTHDYNPLEQAKIQDIEDTIFEMNYSNQGEEEETENTGLDLDNPIRDQLETSDFNYSYTNPTPSRASEIKKTKPFNFTSSHEINQNSIQTKSTQKNDLKQDQIQSETEKFKNKEDLGPALNYAAESGIESDTKKNKKQTLFEKLEATILTKLKKVGLNHYDIWLELARLYEKYGKTDEAVKIYAMILKHAQDETKEFARNKLIALT